VKINVHSPAAGFSAFFFFFSIFLTYKKFGEK